MRKVKDIIGLKVLTFDTGEKVDTVEDVLLDPEEDRVLALLIDRGGWFSRAKIIPFDAIQSIGDDAVIIPTRDRVMLAGDDRKIKQALESDRIVKGMDIYTSDGTYLGTVADMVIDERTGRVEGYEVSGGLVKQTLKGKNFVPTPEKEKVGEEIIFVPPETGARVKEEVTGGIQGTARQATEQVKAKSQEAAEQVKTRGQEVTENLQQAAGQARDRVSEGTVEQQKRFVVGKTASDTVIGPRGNVVVRAGDTITPLMAEDAEREGLLMRLVAATGSAQAGEAMGGLKEEATGAFDEIKKTFQELTQKAQERTKEERIKAALGRPVKRVILDRNDQVILNTGEIITHQAIQRAEDAGVLDVLLSSVSKEEPEFGVEERRAPKSGEAGLRSEE